MDERKLTLVMAGVYLGDISLALAGVSEELPSYVEGLDFNELLGDGEDLGAVRTKVEQELGEKGRGVLPHSLVRKVLEAAIAKGKFLSAGRCLEILGEKETYVDKYLAKAMSRAREGNLQEAARCLVTAANLDFKEGLPFFQYSGPALHDGCITSPDNCVTRLESDNAVLKAMKYLLHTEKTYEAVAQLTPEQRREMLPYALLERDPNAAEFFASYEKAHNDLRDAQQHAIGELKARVTDVASEIGKFANSVGKMSPKGEENRSILERTVRTAAGLVKEFADVGELVDAWQLRRLRRRLEQLIESERDVEAGRRAFGEGGPSGDVFGSMQRLIEELKEKLILDQVEEVEKRLLSSQVTMLGRSVHSQEHWQYLRELAFKYPSSPLVCCLRKINDRWMVVPVWDSPITTILEEHFAS